MNKAGAAFLLGAVSIVCGAFILNPGAGLVAFGCILVYLAVAGKWQ